MTREEELAAIDAAIAAGKLHKVSYDGNEPTYLLNGRPAHVARKNGRHKIAQKVSAARERQFRNLTQE